MGRLSVRGAPSGTDLRLEKAKPARRVLVQGQRSMGKTSKRRAIHNGYLTDRLNPVTNPARATSSAKVSNAVPPVLGLRAPIFKCRSAVNRIFMAILICLPLQQKLEEKRFKALVPSLCAQSPEIVGTWAEKGGFRIRRAFYHSKPAP